MLAGIADNGNGGVVVLGAEASLRKGLDLMHLRVDLRVNDGDPAANLWGKSRGDPLEALAWTVNHVYERGLAVAAGDVVLTGSLTQPQPFSLGTRFDAGCPESATSVVRSVLRKCPRCCRPIPFCAAELSFRRE